METSGTSKCDISGLEANAIACFKSSLMDDGFMSLVKLIAVNRIVNGPKKILQAQYLACLSYGYLFVKGPAYALQAEEHAENARRLLLSCAAEPTEPKTPSEYSTSDNPRTLMLIILLTYYSLARAKLQLNKSKEALKISRKAQTTLDELLSMEPQTNRPPNADEPDIEDASEAETVTTSEYEDVSSLLLKPGNGFFPSLRPMRIRILTLVGRAYLNQKKFDLAEENFTKALSFTEELFGLDCRQKIPILQALSQVFEKRQEKDDVDKVISLNEQAVRIAQKLYEEKPNKLNQIQVATIVHNLSQAYLRAKDLALQEKAEKLLLDTVHMLSNSEEDQSQDGEETALLSARSNDDQMMSVSQQLLHSECEARRQGDQADYEERLKKQHAEILCLLRSTIVRIYLSCKRYEDAEQLMKVNLATQQVVFGLYSPDAVTTQKLLLSHKLAHGKAAHCLTQARECLAMEEVTFGTKSKQARKTREILEVLTGSTT